MPKTVKTRGRVAAPAPNKPAKKKASSSKKKTAASTRASTPKTNYIRNLHNGAGGIRIDLTDGARLLVAPRGQVGDVLLVNEDQRNDPAYQRNKDLLFEELTLAEGEEVIEKQNINAQSSRSTVMDFLTNEKGEKYAQMHATVEPTFESQGQVVGHVSPASEGTSVRDGGNINREPIVQSGLGPQQVEVPGSTAVAFNPDRMPEGLTVDQAKLFIETPREERQELLQRFAQENAEQYRNNLNVTVQDTQRG